ncbi:syntaxin-7 isoform X2 [Cimex lectularius]|uniref:t-SNARE coiled-coil homology domain-containing protein n=1 Tax=Cimex lectularius TaxID=79782 RepID=A0A8I6TD49_CIMLE|nr:syntaxin-7 isoform X2 [Cimex lectularius]
MDRMSGFVPTNYGSTAERVPEVGFSGGGSIYDQKEADALAENVSKIIYSINTERMSLEKSVKFIGTPKDSQELREKMQNTLVSINDKVKRVTLDIKLLKEKMRKGGWQQKLQIQKITETFQESIQMCKPVEELVVAKMRCHMLLSELAILEQNQERFSDSDQLTTSEMRQVTEAIEFETGLLKEREEKMAKIANTIIDINQIMKELGAQVHNQGEDIDRIENAIEDVHVHVTAANEELEKASTYQTGRRKTVCILLALSLIIGVILTTIIVVTLRDKH